MTTQGQITAGQVSQSPFTVDQNYVYLCTSVLVFYDYFLTLPLEFSEIWRGKFTLAKFFYFLNRYPSLLLQVAQIMHVFPGSTDMERDWRTDVVLTHIRCVGSMNAVWFFFSISSLAANCIFIMRTYALYYGKKKVAVILSIMGAISLIGAILNTTAINPSSTYSTLTGQYLCIFTEKSDYNNCKYAYSFPSTRTPGTVFFVGALVQDVSAIIFDSTVFGLTINKTITTAIKARSLKMRNTLAYLFVRDGSVYYFILLLLNIAEIIFHAKLIQDPQALASNTTLFAIFDIHIGIQAVLVNRLILNLCSTAHMDTDQSTFSIVTGVTAPTFASGRVLGNIGAPLRTGKDFQDFSFSDSSTIDGYTDAGDIHLATRNSGS